MNALLNRSNVRNIVMSLWLVLPFLGYTQTIPAGKVVHEEHIDQGAKLEQLSPGGNLYSPSERLRISASIRSQFTKKSDNNRNTNLWETVGPTGIFSSQGFNFVCSGRVRDVEILDDNHIRVASASGGLWDIQKGSDGKFSNKNLSTSVASIWSGTVATDPFNENIILLGTGEPGVRGGAGLWRSSDKGNTWKSILIEGGTGLGAFDEMEYTARPGKVWTCGSDGVFFSKDSGLTWDRKKGGNHPGMVIYPQRPDTMLVAEYDRGIFRTRDGGKTWQSLTNGLPTNDFNRIELSNCKSQPDVIYALYTNTEGFTLGIYKTVNGGDSWSRCTVINANGEKDVDYHWGMAGYCSFISVSPVDPNHVISGGGWYIYSTDGDNFYGPEEGQHPDFHCGGWSKDGKTAWYGNDGGIYATAFDEKWKWDIQYNNLPITQFVTVAVSRTDPRVIIGGTQDNGLVYYNPTVKKWFYLLGDGGGVAIDPSDENKVYGTLGVSNGPLAFSNYRKFGPSAAGWQDINVGLKPSGQWWRLVRTDQNNPTTLFTQTDNKLYYSTNEGYTWEYLGFQDLDILEISSLRVSHGAYPKIYVSGSGPDTSSLMVLDFGIWEWKNITKGLPTKYNEADGLSIAHTYTSDNPTLENRVYALMRGYGQHLEHNVLFKSDDNGSNWTNITGNLPNLPYSVMMEHPSNENILLAGTDGFGVFITEDGGQNWSLWDDGIPQGAFITDMDYQKFNDSIYIVVSTYGSSILRRYLPTAGQVNTINPDKSNFHNQIEKAYFDGVNIIIEVEKNISSDILLKICSIDAKCIFQGTVQSGEPKIKIDLHDLSSGVYICSIQKNQKLLGTARVIVP